MLIPLKVDVPTDRQPWVNYALIVLTASVSLVGFLDAEFYCRLAGLEVTGSEYSPLGGYLVGVTYGLTSNVLLWPVVAVTSSLLHIGWIHLLGNLFFLWVFGNGVNYKFGHLGYLALYLAAAVISGLAHYGMSGDPAVGASGAIYGVMGAFLVFFPRNDIKVLWIVFWVRPGVGTLSSGWILLFWVAWDALVLALGLAGRVALWAHLGGFLAGFGIGLLCAMFGWIKPTADEETLLQVFGAPR